MVVQEVLLFVVDHHSAAGLGELVRNSANCCISRLSLEESGGCRGGGSEAQHNEK